MRQNNILKKSLVLWIVLAFVLAACNPAELTATPAPTANSAPTQSATISQAAAKPAAPAASATLPQRVKGTLLLATTTSTRDTGLLDFLLPIFTQGTGIPISYIAVGSGQALQMGKDGNVDVLLVHSRAAELAFMESKDGVRREDVMYNDFVIVGPASDPAKISGMKSALDAFKAIAAAQAPFVSRGDQSGTNTKELAIWKSANITPQGNWYINAGQGMGAVLLMADEKNAYTLSDRATYLTQSKKGLQLRILVQSGKDLLNPYGVISVNPAKNAQIQGELANKFIDWLISVPVMQQVADFKKDVFGASLFIPISQPWLAAHPEQVNPFAAQTAVPTAAP